MWRLDGVWILETAAYASHTLASPFSLSPSHRGNIPLLWPELAFSDVAAVTGKHRVSFWRTKRPSLLPYLAFSGAWVLLCIPPPWRPRNPKGQLTQLWKTVKILTLAINAYKLGNLSCFIKLSPGTRRHWRPLIEKKQKTNDWPCPFLIYQFLPEPFVLQASVTYRPSCPLL